MMIKQEFEDFLEEQIEKTKTAEIDWEIIKEDWVKDIENFYGLVLKLLDKYLQAGKISTSYTDYTVNEEQLGAYNTRKLLLTFGKQQIDFTPIGRCIFGAQGRIDMEGVSGKVVFIFTRHQSKDQAVSISLVVNGESSSASSKESTERVSPAWKISTPPPGRQYIDINEESFFNSLMEVVNG